MTDKRETMTNKRETLREFYQRTTNRYMPPGPEGSHILGVISDYLKEQFAQEPREDFTPGITGTVPQKVYTQHELENLALTWTGLVHITRANSLDATFRQNALERINGVALFIEDLKRGNL